jgi:DNA-binding LytR/AlgR family response regulator
MLRCLIVDDNKMARAALKQLTGKVDFLELAGECESPEEVFSILQKGDIDLVFLDVEMPGMSGLDLVRSITSRPMIILITAKRDYAVEAYELNVVDYLVKPVQLPRFLASVNRARELKENRNRQLDTVDIG